eukprot:gene17411-12447_t
MACSPTSVASCIFQPTDFVVEDLPSGRGGFGVMFKGTHRTNKKVYALKKLAGVPSVTWEREVTSLQRLTHPNIVKCFGSLQIDGFFTVVMELIDGVTLDKFIELNPPTEGQKVLYDRWYRQLVSALACIHRQGLIHRDMKPSNLVVHRDGHDIVLIDFGVARDVSEDMSIAGTPPYFSYEQMTRCPYDGRADVWALGCTFAFVLTGQSHPFLAVEEQESIDNVRADILRSDRASVFLASQIDAILEGVRQDARPTSEVLLAAIVAYDRLATPAPLRSIGEVVGDDTGTRQSATGAALSGTLTLPSLLVAGPALEAADEDLFVTAVNDAVGTAVLTMPPQTPQPGGDEVATVLLAPETHLEPQSATKASGAILGPAAGIPLEDLDDRSAVALLALVGCILPARLQLDPRLPAPGGGAYLATIDNLEALAKLEELSSDDWERRSVLETAVLPALQKLQREWVPFEKLGDIQRYVSKPAAVPAPESDNNAAGDASAEEAVEGGEGDDAAENESDAPSAQEPKQRKRQANAAVKFFRPLVRAAKSAEKVVVKEARKIERQLSSKK